MDVIAEDEDILDQDQDHRHSNSIVKFIINLALLNWCMFCRLLTRNCKFYHIFFKHICCFAFFKIIHEINFY